MSTQQITLKGGAIVTIPDPYKYAKCRGCGAEDIVWSKTVNGRNNPIRYLATEQCWASHFSDCPKAGTFRQEELSRKAEKAVNEIIANLIERKRTGQSNTEETKQAWKMIIMENFKEVKKKWKSG